MFHLDDEIHMTDPRDMLAKLSPEERIKYWERIEKRLRLYPHTLILRSCEATSLDAKVREHSNQRRSKAEELSFPDLAESGLQYGYDLDCVSSRYFFIGGTGKIRFAVDTSPWYEVIHSGKYVIKDTGDYWRIEYLNDKQTSINFVDFHEAIQTVMDYYRKIGAVPLPQGLAALRSGGIWEMHTFSEQSHEFKLSGGTNYEYQDGKLSIEHEFSITQINNSYLIDKLDGELARLQFGSIDSAAFAVLEHYQSKNLTDYSIFSQGA